MQNNELRKITHGGNVVTQNLFIVINQGVDAILLEFHTLKVTYVGFSFVIFSF